MDSSGSSPANRDVGDAHAPDEYDDVTVVGNAGSLAPNAYPKGLTSRELAHALRGEMLNHFLLQQFIGGGGMGVVFKALDTTLDRIVAVKVVASHRIDNEDLQRRFLIEAQSTARLDHPNIARIHFIGRDRGLPYIVFEYIDGVNVRDLVAEQGPLAVEEAMSYAYQIAHALAHAWKRDVVHRDIKPSNILVTDDGEAKLVDMGLARLVEFDEEDDLTATGITLGTFDYISPEQARDPREADCRSDIYSLGCTIFYMLAGQAPFAQGTAVQKLLQHQAEAPPELKEFRSDVPESVASLVTRMLAKAPEERQQTPVELVHEIADILMELGVRLPHALAPMPRSAMPRVPGRRRRHVVWAAPVALALAGGFVADQMSREEAGGSPPFAPLEVGDLTETGPVVPQTSKAAPRTRSPKATPAPLTRSRATPPAGPSRTPIGPTVMDPFDLSKTLDAEDSIAERFKQWPAGDLALPRTPAVALDPLLAPVAGQREAAAAPAEETPRPAPPSTPPRNRPGPPAPPAE